MSNRRRLILFTCIAPLGLACGLGAPSSSSSGTSSSGLTGAVDEQACVADLKDRVYAGTVPIAEYDARLLSECGIDVNAPPAEGQPKEDPGTAGEYPEAPPTPEEQAYIDCVTALKNAVGTGALDIAAYEAAVALCPAPPPASPAAPPSPGTGK